MTKKKLWGTTTLAGALFLTGGVATASLASAAEVKPLGALDINIGGQLRWYSVFGNLKDKSGGNGGDNPGTYDFETDNEVYIYVRGRDEATGLEYGGNVELEADTNNTSDADEAWVFVKGKFGEFRFGDENGIDEQFITGAQPISTFAGGLDGIQGADDAGALAFGFTSGDSTKVAYYSPVLAGFQLGVSLTPSTNSSGNNIKTTNGDSSDVSDLVEPGLTYTNKFGELGVLASVTGAIGRFSTDNGESRDLNHVHAGLNLSFRNFSLGGSYGASKGVRPFSTAAGDEGDINGGGYIGNFIVDPGSKQQFYNVGGAAEFGPATVSIVYGQTLASHVAGGTPDGKDPEPKYVIGSLELGVAPGLTVGGEVGYFNNSDNTANNDGVIGLAGVKLAF